MINSRCVVGLSVSPAKMARKRVRPDDPLWVCCCCGGLPIIGLVKAAIFVPPPCVFLTVSATLTAIASAPYQTYICARVLYSTALVGPNLRVALLLLLPFALLLAIPVAVFTVAAACSSLFFTAHMLASVFDEREPSLLFGGVAEMYHERCWKTLVDFVRWSRDSPKGLRHRLGDIPEDWRGEFYEVRVARVFAVIVVALFTAVVSLFAGVLIVVGKLLGWWFRAARFAVTFFPERQPWWWHCWFVLTVLSLALLPAIAVLGVPVFAAACAIRVGWMFLYAPRGFGVISVASYELLACLHEADVRTTELVHPSLRWLFRVDNQHHASSTVQGQRSNILADPRKPSFVTLGLTFLFSVIPGQGAHLDGLLRVVQSGGYYALARASSATGSRRRGRREAQITAAEGYTNARSSSTGDEFETSADELGSIFDLFAEDITACGVLAMNAGWISRDAIDAASHSAVVGLPALAVFRVLDRSFDRLAYLDQIEPKHVASKRLGSVTVCFSDEYSTSDVGRNEREKDGSRMDSSVRARCSSAQSTGRGTTTLRAPAVCTADNPVWHEVVARRLWGDITRLWKCMRTYRAAVDPFKSQVSSELLQIRVCVAAEPDGHLTTVSRKKLETATAPNREAEMSKTGLPTTARREIIEAEEALFKAITSFAFLLTRLGHFKDRLGPALRRIHQHESMAQNEKAGPRTS
ncbi:unnamed protein product [Amoebophrya sp. A25]|nr:unnamed protein product [Amoebophrya sp. A25]|eukprot:GSA25T00001793001.1